MQLSTQIVLKFYASQSGTITQYEFQDFVINNLQNFNVVCWEKLTSLISYEVWQNFTEKINAETKVFYLAILSEARNQKPVLQDLTLNAQKLINTIYWITKKLNKIKN